MWVRQEAGEGQWDVKELEKEIKGGGMFMKGEGRYWDNLSQSDGPQYTHDTEYCYCLKKALLHIHTKQRTVGVLIFNSLASKFELRAQPLSVEIKMSPHVPNCS